MWPASDIITSHAYKEQLLLRGMRKHLRKLMKEKKSRELQIPMNFYKSKKRNGSRKYSSRNKGVIEKIS